MGNLGLIMWISLALVVVVGVPFTLWYWKRIDAGAPATERRFPPKPDQREKVRLDDLKEDTSPGDDSR